MNKKCGATLIELVISSLLLGILFTAIALALFTMLESSTNNYLVSKAGMLAGNEMERLRAIPLGTALNVSNEQQCDKNNVCINLSASKAPDPSQTGCDKLVVTAGDTQTPTRFKNITIYSEKCQ